MTKKELTDAEIIAQGRAATKREAEERAAGLRASIALRALCFIDFS